MQDRSATPSAIKMATEVKPDSVHEAAVTSPDEATTTKIKSPTASTKEASDKETLVSVEQPKVSFGEHCTCMQKGVEAYCITLWF